MDFVFDLLQGAGIAAAIGIRPFLPVLLVGALAAANLGLDFEGTDFFFLETWPFLLAIVVALVALDFAARRWGARGSRPGRWRSRWGRRRGPGRASRAAASLADRGFVIWPGVLVGAACAVLGFVSARSFFTRVRRRLDERTAAALPVYADAAGLLAAGLSVLFPPFALVVLAALGWLLAGGRRREGEKYAGLRILR